MKLFGVILILGILVSACKKPEDRACWKGIGESSELEIPLDAFDKLLIHPHMKVNLVQGNEHKVVVSGGKNLLNFISTSIVDGQLELKNENKCNFLRKYDESVTVSIYFEDLERLNFQGTWELNCETPITTDALWVDIIEGAGKVNLDVDCSVLRVSINNGWGNMALDGSVDFVRYTLSSNGFVDAYNLNVQDSIHVRSYSSGISKVNADDALFRCETGGAGDIWYIGEPSFIEHNQVGEGELIDKN